MNEIQKKMISMVDFDKFFETVKITSELTEAQIDKSVVMEYLEIWAAKKEWLFVKFGEKLKMEEPLDVPPDFTNTASFLSKIMDQYPMYASAISTFSTEEFMNNCVESVNKDSAIYTYFSKIYKVGAKPSKILSKLLKDPQFDIDLSKELQNRVSTGRAVISIDPIDFAMVSTSDHNWTSCMDIIRGFNKFGGYSLMMDDCTIIAYHCSSDDAVYKNGFGSFSWNNKISRMIMFCREAKDGTTVCLGHNISNPSASAKECWIKMLSNAFDGKFKTNDSHFYAQKAGAFYYDSYVDNVITIGNPKRWVPTIGVSHMRCVRCGKPFERLVGYKGWLTCNQH